VGTVSMQYPYAAHGGDQTEICGSPDDPVFLDSLFSDGDSVYLNETPFEILGTPYKTCLIFTGTSMKTCWKLWLL